MSRSRYEPQIRRVLADRQHELAIDFDGVEVTWASVNAVASGIERIVDAAGLGETDKVGLMGRNRPAHFAALWGVFISGRCLSMIHAFQPTEALAAEIAQNRWPMVIGERRDWTEEVIAAANAAGTVGYAFADDPSTPFELVTESAKPGPQTDRRKDDTVLQLLSSGTTGKPKRISLSRGAVDEMIERTMAQFAMAGPTVNTTQILPWPISSLGGSNGALPAVALGQRLAIQQKFNPRGLLEMIRRYRPRFLSAPPSGIAMVLQLKPSREDLSSIALYSSGSAPLDPIVRGTLENEYEIPVADFYGATEFAGIISGWTPADLGLLKAKRGSVGRALPGMQIRIVSTEAGMPLGPGETGIIEALVPRIGRDWVRTNDLGSLDEDGFLYLHGRADDVIIRGGLKVFPEEIAEILRTHPKVADAAVIGIPNERLGSVPAAAIQTRNGSQSPTPEELEQFLRTKLVPYKIPVRFAIVDELPRTESMKPRREGMRALFP